MSTSFAPLLITKRLRGVYAKVTPPGEHGPDGWYWLAESVHGGQRSFIASCADHEGVEWVHASVAAVSRLPTYEDLKHLHAAVFGAGYAYQVFAPPSEHVNIHPYALHLWGRLDGRPALPEFGAAGSI